jgi:hypothetical protein
MIWEEDVAGNRGWEHIVVPVVLRSGDNELEFRLYKKGRGNMPISVWLDDVAC